MDLRFPKLKPLMSEDQSLVETLIIGSFTFLHVQAHDAIGIDVDLLIANDDLFKASTAQYLNMCISNVKFILPFDHEFTLLWIFTIHLDYIKSKFGR